MRCLVETLTSVREHAYAHPIQRLRVLGNLTLLAGVEPRAVLRWMRNSFVDAADWVMVPNVIGMAHGPTVEGWPPSPMQYGGRTSPA